MKKKVLGYLNYYYYYSHLYLQSCPTLTSSSAPTCTHSLFSTPCLHQHSLVHLMEIPECRQIFVYQFGFGGIKKTSGREQKGNIIWRIFTVFNPTPVIIPTELEVSCFHVLDKDVRSSDIRPIMTEIFGRSFFIPLAKNLPLVGPCYFTPRIIYFIEAFMSPFLLHLPI